jgi:hypothetical protein
VISAKGVVSPLVLPTAQAPLGELIDELVTVTPASLLREDTLGVDVSTVAGATQVLADGRVLPLETVVAPHRGWATFLKVGASLLPSGQALPTGPLERHAWVIEVAINEGWLRGVYPATFPLPALWVLEGVAFDEADPGAGSVGPVLEGWLAGDVEGVEPQVDACHAQTDPSARGATAADTWRLRMLAGSWSEPVVGEVLLGLASVVDADPVLWLRTFDGDGVEVPAAAVLSALGVVDPVFMSTNPVVIQAGTAAADVPVRIHVRLDFWNVDATSPGEPKGGEGVLQPDAVRIVPDDGGAGMAGATVTWVDPITIVEIARGQLDRRAFHLEADFPAAERIRLERGQERFQPADGGPWTWSSAGWSARSGGTTGSWTNFVGTQIGSPASPVTFWVGTKVRATFEYDEQVRGLHGERGATVAVQARRAAPGHVIPLYRFKDSVDFYDTFTTDDDGEISGMTFRVPPGEPIGLAISRALTVPSLGLDVDVQDMRGQPPTLFGTHPFFWSEDAAQPFHHDAFVTGDLSATLRIDSSRSDDSKGNTAHAAALHALKHMRFTHDAFALLKGQHTGLPARHQFQFEIDDEAGPSTRVASQDFGWQTITTFPSSRWFARADITHEYMHAIARHLANAVTDASRRDELIAAIDTFGERFKDEREQDSVWHKTSLLTNGGLALSEGLAEFACILLDAPTSMAAASESNGPPGFGHWARYIFLVAEPVAHTQSHRSRDRRLSDFCGRNVEGVFAGALHEFVVLLTDLPRLFRDDDDDEQGYRQPGEYFEDWLAEQADPEASAALLHQLVDWLLVDPIRNVLGHESPWSGRWPEPTGASYPTPFDYLSRIRQQAAARAPAVTSFAQLHDDVLVPWNLEKEDDKDGQLVPDWEP